jgi:methylated-DNA-[protein]-cysteine S-methyltransferase
MNEITTATLDTPIGPLTIDAAADGIVAIRFAAGPRPDPAAMPPCLRQALAELAAYFAGRLTAFAVPLRPRGTPFQTAVWTQLTAIPYGATTTYRRLAAAVGRPAAIRAAGAANGRNPIPIIIPCHRVIGSDGSLTGYAGGIDKKQWLLAHEQKRGGHR